MEACAYSLPNLSTFLPFYRIRTFLAFYRIRTFKEVCSGTGGLLHTLPIWQWGNPLHCLTVHMFDRH